MKETHFLPFFCACRHPTNCQGRGAKMCGVSGSGDESLASKCGTKCTQKNPCPGMHGFCNFAVFVNQKSRAPEHVKRDPHVFDLVLFLHPKKCLRRRKVCAPFGSGNGPRNLCLVVFWTFASIAGKIFCLYSRSLLPLQQVSFASIAGVFCLYSRSLLLL